MAREMMVNVEVDEMVSITLRIFQEMFIK